MDNIVALKKSLYFRIILLVQRNKTNKGWNKMELTIIIISLSILYITYLIIEKYYYKNLRKHFKHIIHVNGTRGKTSVTRMIGHILSENEYSVCVKTTGTIPTIILPNNEEVVIKRLGRANIKEQLKVMKIAKKNGADILVIECMAITPKYQFITHHKMLNANITVLTNVRLDHQDVLGKSEVEIAESFYNTISESGVLFVNEKYKSFYIKETEKRQTKVISFNDFDGKQDIDLYPDNIGAVLKVGEYFNIDNNKALDDLKTYKKDVGSIKIYKFEGHTFINGFSINDVESLKITLENLKILNIKTFLINNRNDRAFRAKEHLTFLKDVGLEKLYVAGGFYNYFKNSLKGVEVIKYKSVLELEKEEVVFGFGNFKNKGLKIINYYESLNSII